MKIGILDYGAGNIKSVQNALDRMINPHQPTFIKGGVMEYFLSDDPVKLAKADKIIFPGVGNAKPAMEILKNKKLDVFLKNFKKPVLGICLGMQMLCEYSEEDDTECLGIIPGKVVKFESEKVGKIPHMGWNEVSINNKQLTISNKKTEHVSIFDVERKGEELGSYFYFVHSYYVPVSEFTVSTCKYGNQEFSAVVQKDNFIGCQFHPEKSGEEGEEILKKFINDKF